MFLLLLCLQVWLVCVSGHVVRRQAPSKVVEFCKGSKSIIVDIGDQTTGTVRSVNYNVSDYKNNTKCNVVFRTQDKPLLISVFFRAFNVEYQNRTCSYDKLCVYGVRFCGNWTAGQTFDYLVPSNKTFTLNFETDLQISAPGFELTVTAKTYNGSTVSSPASGVGTALDKLKFSLFNTSTLQNYTDKCKEAIDATFSYYMFKGPNATMSPWINVTSATTTARPLNTTVSPANTTTVKPANTTTNVTTVKPLNTTTAAPINTTASNVTTVKPLNTTTAAPINTTASNVTTVKPLNTTTAAPINTTAANVNTVKPLNTTTAAPINTTTAAPINTTTAANVTTVKPLNTTTAAPINTTTAAPINTTAANVTTVKPLNTTTAAPINTTAANVTTVKPLNTTTAAPINTTASNVTTVKPLNTTTASPVNTTSTALNYSCTRERGPLVDSCHHHHPALTQIVLIRTHFQPGAFIRTPCLLIATPCLLIALIRTPCLLIANSTYKYTKFTFPIYVSGTPIEDFAVSKLINWGKLVGGGGSTSIFNGVDHFKIYSVAIFVFPIFNTIINKRSGKCFLTQSSGNLKFYVLFFF
ncbi:hypothetical protein Btru_054027 [Bulinus truncatus]|nr:hypothetical protein Btru_054027 [Bulinus truncatus]